MTIDNKAIIVHFKACSPTLKEKNKKLFCLYIYLIMMNFLNSKLILFAFKLNLYIFFNVFCIKSMIC